VNDLTLHLIVEWFEMRNLQGAHRLNGHGETLIGAATRLGGSEPLSRGSQDAKHLRPIESLTFTVITEAHVVPRLRKKSVHRSCVANILPSTATRQTGWWVMGQFQINRRAHRAHRGRTSGFSVISVTSVVEREN
jgi:hypothetical protein